MSTESDTPIEIRPVGNGFIVMPARREMAHDRVTSAEETMVFQSFAALSHWLSEHFDFRCSEVKEDPAGKIR